MMTALNRILENVRDRINRETLPPSAGFLLQKQAAWQKPDLPIESKFIE